MHLATFIAILITLPIVVLLYVTATPRQHAKRMRASGSTYKAIAKKLKVSQTTARNYCLA